MSTDNPKYTKQPTLPGIDFAPKKVRKHGLQETHSYPLVSNGKEPTEGRFTGSFRVPARYAWKFRSLEIRSATAWPALTLDVDDPDAYERLCGLCLGKILPWPNWTVERIRNGHIQPTWTFFRPVLRGPGARKNPLLVLGRIAEYYREATGGDHGFGGCLQHNPMARAYRVGEMRTYWGPTRPYGLEQLKVVIPSGWRMPPEPTTEYGRNCFLFKDGCRWGGSPRNHGRPVLPYLEAQNQRLTSPLDLREVAGIARSVERYRKGQTYYTSQQRSLWGQERGIRSGQARRSRTQKRDETILLLASQGWTQRAIAAQVGLSAMGVNKVLKRLVNRTTQLMFSGPALFE